MKNKQYHRRHIKIQLNEHTIQLYQQNITRLLMKYAEILQIIRHNKYESNKKSYEYIINIDWILCVLEDIVVWALRRQHVFIVGTDMFAESDQWLFSHFKAGKHQPDAKQLAQMKPNCVVASHWLESSSIWTKKLPENTPNRKQPTKTRTRVHACMREMYLSEPVGGSICFLAYNGKPECPTGACKA